MLKITDKTTDPRVMFVELGPGDLFKWNRLCMKIQETKAADPAVNWYNVVDLESHCLFYISPTTRVMPIHAELIISDKEED